MGIRLVVLVLAIAGLSAQGPPPPTGPIPPAPPAPSRGAPPPGPIPPGLGPSSPAPPTPEQQQIQAIIGLLMAEREKTEALALAAATKTQQIAQLQQALQGAPAACVAEIDKANPGKTVDARTWIITTKGK